MERTGGVVSDVMDVMEQAFLLGLGVASVTKERVERSLDDVVERGRMSRTEGTQLIERLRERGRLERDNLQRLVREEMHRTLESADLVSREEHRALESRVARLEARLGVERGGPHAPAHGEAARRVRIGTGGSAERPAGAERPMEPPRW